MNNITGEAPLHGVWLPDETVRTFLDKHYREFQVLPFLMVTSIDSDKRPGLMPWAERRIRSDPTWSISTVPLVLSGSRIVEMIEDPTLFTGFDEIWVLPSPVATEPPSDALLVSPRRLARALPSSIEQWVRASNALLGLGDGDGLNVVVVDSALARGLGLG